MIEDATQQSSIKFASRSESLGKWISQQFFSGRPSCWSETWSDSSCLITIWIKNMLLWLWFCVGNQWIRFKHVSFEVQLQTIHPRKKTPETPTQQRSRHHCSMSPKNSPWILVAHAAKQWDPPCQLPERHQQHSGRWWRTRKTTHPHGPLTSDLISIAGKAEKIMRTYHQKSFKSAIVLWV